MLRRASLSLGVPTRVATAAAASRRGAACAVPPLRLAPSSSRPSRNGSSSSSSSRRPLSSLSPAASSRASSSASSSSSSASSSSSSSSSSASALPALPTPRDLLSHLDAYVIGQSSAKRVLCVALHNHLVRLRAEELAVEARALAERQREEVREMAWRSGREREEREREKAREREKEVERERHANGHYEILSDWVGQQAGAEYAEREREAVLTAEERVEFFSSAISRASRPPRSLPSSSEQEDASSSTSPPSLPRARRRPSASTSDSDVPLPRPNILLLGPSGSGKTLLLSTLAKGLNLPFLHVDATPLTQAGYVGEDAENIVARLLAAAGGDARRAEMGVVVIDEVDKLARRPGDASSKDVSGEGVQQSLLRILEGAVIGVPDKNNTGGGGAGAQAAAGGAAGVGGREGKESWWPTSMEREGKGSAQAGVTHVDTSGVLFVLCGAFIGLDKVIRARLAGVAEALEARAAQPGASAATKSAAQEARRTAEEAQRSEDLYGLAEPEDLQNFGLIPEFLGRVPVTAALSPLSEDELVRVLCEPRHALVKEYEALFSAYGVELRITSRALRALASQAVHKRTGARALRRLLEGVLLEAQFLAPGSSVRFALVDERAARGEAPVHLYSRGGRGGFVAAWEEERDLPPSAATAHSTNALERASSSTSTKGGTQRTPLAALLGEKQRGAGMGISPEARRERQAMLAAAEKAAAAGGARWPRPRPLAWKGKEEEAALRRWARARLARPSRVGNLRIVAE